MLQPALLDGVAVGDTGVQRIVTGDVLPGRGADAVARIGIPWVGRLLRPVLLYRKTFQRTSIRPQVRQVIDQRNREQGFCTAVGARGGDISVGRSRGRAATVGVGFEIPVRGGRVRVDLPVVPAGGVAAPAVERGVQGCHVVRIPVGDAIYVGINGVPVGAGVDIHRGGWILREALHRTE